ncbi:MAG TPA: HAMP domain-containing sensor histidine kinase [Candidatus Binatia bacterium]|jgi:signal transduction histidine kinase|nr:HAMP domain-containing sensor histidine kinase [Candidatus Binatia bacterium]
MWDIAVHGFFDDRAEAASAEEVAGVHRWLGMPRVAAMLYGFLAVLGSWALGYVAFDPRPFFFFVVPEYVLGTLLISRLMGRKVRPMLLLHLQLILDLAAVTCAVAYTGGVRSPFVLLFLLVVVSASLVSVRSLLGIGIATALIYETMSVAGRAGLVPALRSSPFPYQLQDALTLGVLGLIVALIAFQSSYYLSKIREKDEEVLKLKDEFMFRTIHDLRSPSAVIRFILKKYETKYGETFPNGEGSGYGSDIKLVGGALGRMTVLIEDLLKLAAGERPEFKVRSDKLDLRPVIEGAAQELGPLMGKKGIAFSYVPEGAAPVLGDADKLREVFGNFLDNAVKYNKEGGSIAVRHRVEGSFLATEIEDTGVGISTANMEKLFTPYFRGDAGKQVPGTGLGLYLTRKLLEKMRGSVAARSERGRGSVFTVYLPLA